MATLIPFRVFKSLFLKSTIAKLHTTKHNSAMLQICSQSDLEQLGIYTVRLRHRDKSIKCRFFVVAGDGLALLGMPNIDLLSILRIACDVRSKPHKSKKYDSQLIKTSTSQSTQE